MVNFKPRLLKLWKRVFLKANFKTKEKQFSVHRHFKNFLRSLLTFALNMYSGSKYEPVRLITHIFEDQKLYHLDYSNIGKIVSFCEELQPNLRFNLVL